MLSLVIDLQVLIYPNNILFVGAIFSLFAESCTGLAVSSRPFPVSFMFSDRLL
jgi:hypothetical protein